MNGPLLSVIMPVYNCEKYVAEAIRSVIHQTFSDWELLVCDDASTDRTYSIVKTIAENDHRVRIFRNETNIKVLRTRNKLLTLARGDFITFQDADDYSDISRFEKMIDEFRSNSQLGLLATQVGYVGPSGKLLRVSAKPTDFETTSRLMYQSNVVGGAIMMIKKEALVSVGGCYRTFFDGLSNQDYDLSLLIAEKYVSYSLPDVLYFYRQHESSSSKIVDVDRLVAKHVVIHLACQRKARGSDDLIDGHLDKVQAYFEALRQPYRNDPSLVYREYAAAFMYSRLYRRAIRTAWLAVKTKPSMTTNWGTLQYCVRKTILENIF